MVVSTSGSLREREDFDRGVDLWRSWGYEITFSEGYDNQAGYLAGTDQERRSSLLQAWNDPTCRGILCSRGGYGRARLLEDWHWPDTEPKWLLGFSDVTGILWSLAKAGVESLHGPVLTTLADEPDWAQTRLRNYLSGKPLDSLQGKGWGGGKVQGRLVVANLTVATHLLGTPWQPNFQNVILAIEDVTEAPYRIDRMLTQWKLNGIFDQLEGVVLGQFRKCIPEEPEWSFTLDEVFDQHFKQAKFPVFSGFLCGHILDKFTLPIGQTVEMNASDFSITPEDASVKFL
jgi:muramoyltetrapeptide carboxypeptidase